MKRKTAYRVFFAMTIGFTTIRLFLSSISMLIVSSELVGKILFYGIYAVCFIILIPVFASMIKVRDLLIMLVWTGYCYAMARSAAMDSVIYIDTIKYILVFGTVFFLTGILLVCNQHMARDVLYNLPIPLNLMGISQYALRIMCFSSTAIDTYSMEMTYASLVSATICTVVFLSGQLNDEVPVHSWSSNKEIAVINLVVSYVLVLLGGSRGPVLALFIIASICSVYSIKKKKNVGSLLVVTVGLFVAILSVSVLFEISTNYTANNIRIVTMLQKKELLSTSGREHYVYAALQGIRDNAFSGIGVFHDRVYIYSVFHRSYAVNSTGSYPHNIILEILLQYGIPLGAILLFILFILIIHAFKQSSDSGEIEMICTLLGIGFFPLMVSKSYVQTWEFYMLIGYLLGSKRQYCRVSHLKRRRIA